VKRTILFMMTLLATATVSAGADIDALIAAEHDSLIAMRRHLHQHPELSNREFETAKTVADYLRSIGLTPRTGVAKTGVVVVIEGRRPLPCVLLRSDMDALPINEPNDVPYRSKAPGVKHACGHDVHMTVLLGAAKVLNSMRGDLNGSVKIVFQPAEEGPPPGERGGAELMIEEGVLENPRVSAAFAFHVEPRVDAGIVTVRPGPDMANADTFEIMVAGQRSHGALPHLGLDPIPVAAQIVLALHSMMERTQDATSPAVLSIGVIEGGNRMNILAGSVRLSGTVRTLDLQQRQDILSRIEKIARSIADGNGTTAAFSSSPAAVMVDNDATLAAFVRTTLETSLGADHVRELPPQMVAEDFGYFSRHVPSVFMHLGIRNESKGFVYPLHHELFDADEAAIPVGIKAFCALALEYLRTAP